MNCTILTHCDNTVLITFIIPLPMQTISFIKSQFAHDLDLYVMICRPCLSQPGFKTTAGGAKWAEIWFHSCYKWCPSRVTVGSPVFTMFVNDILPIVSSPTHLCVCRWQKDFSLYQKQWWSCNWALQNDLLKFNISKCKHVHFGPVHQFGSYY